jgi:hypothetical protein
MAAALEPSPLQWPGGHPPLSELETHAVRDVLDSGKQRKPKTLVAQMIPIRPHQVFALVKGGFKDRVIRVVMPALYTPVLLETSILVALSRFVKAQTFFEFGTYLGVQTLNIAMNMPEHARVWTLDFDADSYKRAKQHAHDVSVSERHFDSEDALAFLDTPEERKITRLFCDSNDFDSSPYSSLLDMVYVDGGHDARTLEADTKSALDMIKKDKLSCIAWHDYKNPHHPQLTAYLDQLSATHTMYHVEETMLCFHLNQQIGVPLP